MSDSQSYADSVGNSGFSGIKDTVYDSKIQNGLIKLGVISDTFKVVKALYQYDASLSNGAVGSYALLDAQTGNQIQLAPGSHVVFAASYQDLTSGGSATTAVGLAAAAGDGQSIASSLISATAISTTSYADKANVVVSANSFLVMTIATAAITGGGLEVNLLIL